MKNSTSFATEFGLIMVGAIIFVASFLWKDFLSDVEGALFPKHGHIAGRFLYVMTTTIILVIIAIYLKNSLELPIEAIKFDDEPIEGFGLTRSTDKYRKKKLLY